MGGEWREHTFADLIQAKALEISDGYRAKNSELGGDGPIFLRAGHVRDTHIDLDGAERFHRRLADVVASKMSRPGDVIVTTKGNSTGRTSYVSEGLPSFVYSPHLSYWRSLNAQAIVPGFLRHWSCSKQFRDQLAGMAASTDMAPYLSLVDQKRLRIALPPSDEQRAIAHILGTLDDKIELNRRMNETLEVMARALFQSWFVDFDPVRAKMGAKNFSPLPKHILDLFPARFVDSELGEIPEEWEVGQIADITGFLGGYAFRSQDWVEHGVPVVKIGSVKPGIVDLSAVSYVPKHVAEKAMRFLLSPGDLLIGMTGYVGEVGLIPPTDNPPLLNQRVGKFVLEKPGTAALAFLFCLTRRSEFKAQVETGAHGTAQANVSAETILSIPLIMPPKALMGEFNRVSQPIIDQILANHAESVTLAALRDTLLPKLISGELRIKDAERFVGRAV